MFINGFSHSVTHRMFPCVAWSIIMDKMDKPDLLQSTRRPFKSMDLALSREVKLQGQRNRAIVDQLPRLGKRELICLLLFTCYYVVSVWRGFLFLWYLGRAALFYCGTPCAFHIIIFHVHPLASN